MSHGLSSIIYLDYGIIAVHVKNKANVETVERLEMTECMLLSREYWEIQLGANPMLSLAWICYKPREGKGNSAK